MTSWSGRNLLGHSEPNNLRARDLGGREASASFVWSSKGDSDHVGRRTSVRSRSERSRLNGGGRRDSRCVSLGSSISLGRGDDRRGSGHSSGERSVAGGCVLAFLEYVFQFSLALCCFSWAGLQGSFGACGGFGGSDGGDDQLGYNDRVCESLRQCCSDSRGRYCDGSGCGSSRARDRNLRVGRRGCESRRRSHGISLRSSHGGGRSASVNSRGHLGVRHGELIYSFIWTKVDLVVVHTLWQAVLSETSTIKYVNVAVEWEASTVCYEGTRVTSRVELDVSR